MAGPMTGIVWALLRDWNRTPDKTAVARPMPRNETKR